MRHPKIRRQRASNAGGWAAHRQLPPSRYERVRFFAPFHLL
uniref:Uncharacterized protein n=1 Tax=Arundo donax TaxID=35708 RepID=A0A0A9H3W8_ARUDO